MFREVLSEREKAETNEVPLAVVSSGRREEERL